MNRKVVSIFLGMLILAGFLPNNSCVKAPTGTEPPEYIVPVRAVQFDTANFDSLVLDSGRIALVEFYSAGCHVCAGMAWVIDSLSAKYDDSVLVGAVNTDTDDSLWKKFSVTSVPSYLLFENRKLMTRRSYSVSDSTAFDTLSCLVDMLLHAVPVIDTSDTAFPVNITKRYAIDLTGSNFDSLVLESGVSAIVEFCSPLSSTCAGMSGIIDSLAFVWGDSALVGRVNTNTDDTLWKRNDVWTVPTYLFFRNGSPVTRRSYDSLSPGTYDTLASIFGKVIAGNMPADTANDTAVPEFLTPVNYGFMTAVPGRIAMVEFFSPLCGACESMEVPVANLAVRFQGRALIAKVNVTEQDSLRDAHNIYLWPTFIFLDGGVEKSRKIGSMPEDSLAAIIESMLSAGY